MIALSPFEVLFEQVAELALESKDLDAFRNAWLTCVSASLCGRPGSAASTSGGTSFASRTINTHLSPRELAGYIHEIDWGELGRVMEGRMMLDDYVFPQARRGRLAVYRDFLLPHRVVCDAMRGWIRRGTAFFMFFSKQRGTRSFQAEDLLALDALVPVIAVGEALHALPAQKATSHAASLLAEVTRAERAVVSLAQRGLSNAASKMWRRFDARQRVHSKQMLEQATR